MKKLLFSLLMLGIIGTATAQTRTAESAKEQAIKYLREEGYASYTDKEGCLYFILQGYNYYLAINEQMDGSLFLSCETAFSTDQPWQKILEGCNTSNADQGAVKFYAVRNEDDSVVYVIAYESFCNPTDDFIKYLEDAISLLPRCVLEFASAYDMTEPE